MLVQDYRSCGRMNRDTLSPTRRSGATGRTLTCELICHKNLTNPKTRSALREPLIDVGLGKLSRRVQLEADGAGDRFRAGSTIHLPYCGEDKFRVVLSDGTFIIGYKDVTAAKDEDQVEVDIRDREGHECGSVTLRYRKHNTRLQTDIPAPGDRTPLTAAPPSSAEPPATRPEPPAPAPAPPANNGLADFTVRSDSDLEESIESGVRNADDEKLPRNEAVNSLRVRVNENCVMRNSQVRCVLGKNETRLRTFGIDGDEAVLPYSSERYAHFIVQTEHNRLGTGKLDLSEIVAANPEGAVRMSVPVYDKEDTVGALDVSVNTSRMVEPKAKVNDGANMNTLATNTSSTPVNLTVAKVSHMKKHSQPTSYSLKATYDGKTYRSDPATLPADSDELELNSTLLLAKVNKKYCKVALVDEASDAEVGRVYLDVDQRKKGSAKDLTNNAGVCHSVYTTKVEKQARSGFVGSTRFGVPICGIEVKVLAAYDLVYDNPDDVLDPYVEINYGSHKITGKNHKNAGLNPIFMETYTLPPSDSVQVSVKDKAMLHKDTPIGTMTIDVDNVSPGTYTADLVHESSHYGGSVIYEIRYLRDQHVKKASVKQDENIADYKGMHSTDLSKLTDAPGYTKGLQAIIQTKNMPIGDKTEYTVYNGKNKASSTAKEPVIVVFPTSDSRVLRVDVKSGKKTLGSGNVDLTEFSELCKTSPPNSAEHEQIVPLKDEHGKQVGTAKVILQETEEVVAAPKVLNGAVQKSKHAKVPTCTVAAGSCRVRVAEGHDIDLEADPFVKISWRGKEARTRTLKTADQNGVRHWEDEFVLPTIPAQESTTLTLTDNIKMHKDKILGTAEITDMKEILDKSTPTEREVTFHSPGTGNAGGRIRLIFYPSPDAATKLKCVPASEAVPAGTYNSVKLTVICGSDFKFGKGRDVCGPFLTVKHDTYKLKGKNHKNAGLNPVFMETFTLPIRPGYPIEIAVADKDTLGKDTPVGTATIELPDLLRTHPDQAPLSTTIKLNGKSTGTLNCSMTLLKEKVEKPTFTATDQKAIRGATAQDLVEFQGEPMHKSIRLRAVNASNLPLKPKNASSVCFTHRKQYFTIGGAPHGGPDPMYEPEVVSLPSTNKAYVKVTVMSAVKDVTGYIFLGDVYESVKCEPRIVDVPLVDALGQSSGHVSVEYMVSDRSIEKPCSTPGYLVNDADMSQTSRVAESASPSRSVGVAAPTGETFEALDIELVKLQGIPAGETADPYVQVTLGNQKVRGHTVKNGGSTCAVGDLFKLPHQPVEFMKFEVFNDKKLARDPLLSSAKLSLGPIVSNPRYEEVQRLKLPLFKGDGTDGGNLYMKVRGYRDPIYTQATCCINGSTGEDSPGQGSVYGSSPLYSTSGTPVMAESSVAAASHPFKSMRVEVLNTTHLGVATADPYIVAKLGKHSLRTHTVEDGGENAEFGDELYFPYNGEEQMTMTFFNNRRMRRDEEFGTCKINLEPVVTSGDTQVITGRLVDAKTGAATSGEVTVIVTPSTKSEPKAYAISPLEDEEQPAEPVAKLPASALQLDDMIVTGLTKPADGTPLKPYVMCKLGRGKLRTAAPVNQDARGAEFGEVFQFNTTKAPSTLSVKAYNNIKMHPDQALGSAELDLLKLTKQEGAFEVPLKGGAALTGIYRWMNEDMGKTKARIIMTPESAAKFATSPTHAVERAIVAGGNVLDESVKSYVVTVEKQQIIGGEKPYVEVSLGDHMVRFEPVFDMNGKVQKEEGIIPSDGFAHAILRVKDDLRLKKDHVLYQAHVDLTDLRAGDAATRLITCMGPNAATQCLELHFRASTDPVKKPKVTKL